jgi:CRP-like cAMP-binding protein
VLRLDPAHLGAQQFVTMFKARQLASLPPGAELDETMDDMSQAVFVPGPDHPGQPEGEPERAAPRITLTEIISPEDLESDSMTIPLPAGDLPSGPVAAVDVDRIVISEMTVPPSQPISVAPAGELLGAQKRELIESLLATTPSQLIDALEPDAVRALLDAASLQRCRKGDIIFRQDETGSSLYLILKGSVDVERRGASGQSRRLATLHTGAFFGEMALLADVPRSATVRASSDAILLKLSRKDVRALSEGDPRVLALLMRFFRARLVGTLMATSPLFKPLSVDERRALVGRFRMRELPDDTLVLAQGRPSDGLYLVLVGRLGVLIEDDYGHITELGSLGPGDVFGEMSFITGEPAMASIRTLDRAWVLRLPKEDLDAVVQSHPEVLELLSEIAAGRRAKNRETMDVDA